MTMTKAFSKMRFRMPERNMLRPKANSSPKDSRLNSRRGSQRALYQRSADDRPICVMRWATSAQTPMPLAAATMASTPASIDAGSWVAVSRRKFRSRLARTTWIASRDWRGTDRAMTRITSMRRGSS